MKWPYNFFFPSSIFKQGECFCKQKTPQIFLPKYLTAETEHSTAQRIADMELALVNPTETDFSYFHSRDTAGKLNELIFHNSEKEEKVFLEEK